MKQFFSQKRKFGSLIFLLLFVGLVSHHLAISAMTPREKTDRPTRQTVAGHECPTNMTIEEAMQYESRVGDRDAVSAKTEGDRSFIPGGDLAASGPVKNYPIPPNAIYCGETTYDFQWHGGPQRSIEHAIALDGPHVGRRFVHVAWMCLKIYELTNSSRNVHYNCYDWSVPGWTVSTDSWGGTPIIEAGERGGYAHVEVNSDGNAVVFHHSAVEDAERYARVARFSIPGMGIYTADRLTSLEGQENIWLRGAIGTEDITPGIQEVHDVYHVGGHDYFPGPGDPAIQCYWRYAYAPGEEWPVWEGPVPMGQSMTISHELCADGERVIYAWSQARYYGLGRSQYNNDLGYWESTAAGADWIANGGFDQGDWEAGAGYNVTDYVDTDPHRVYIDISIMFDFTGRLHAIFTTPGFDDAAGTISVGPTVMQHWYEGETPNTNAQVSGGTPIGFVGGTAAYHSIAASALWGCCTPEPVTGGAGAWNRNISKMTLGIGDGSTQCTDPDNGNNNYGYLYALYTLFGGVSVMDREDWSISGWQNGNIYISMSNDNGQTWDAGRCLTTASGNFALGEAPTWSAGCNCPTGDPADPECEDPCMSEHWGSMARIVNDTLHAFYVVDYDAGGIPFDEGNWAVNKVVYHPLIGDGEIDGNLCPIFAPVLDVTFNAEPGCEYHGELAPGRDPMDYAPLTICNYGNDDLYYTVQFDQISGGPNEWILVDGAGSLPPTTILPGGECNQHEISMDANQTPGKGMYRAEIEIDHNDPNPLVGDPYVIPISFFVADSFVCGQGVVTTTPCVALEVSNVGSWGRENSAGGMRYYAADDDDSLFNPVYDASLVIANKTAGPDALVYRDIFSNQTPGNPGFRALEQPKLSYNAATNESLVTANQVTNDSTVGISVKYLFPQDGDSCDFVRMVYRLYPNTFSDPNLIVGAAADLDVGTTTDGMLTNGDMGGWIPAYNLVFCHGTEEDTLIDHPDTSDVTTQYAAGLTALTCEQNMRAVVQSNRNYVYPAGGFTDQYLFEEFDSAGLTIWIDQEDGDDGMDYVDDLHVLLAYPEITLAEDAWDEDGCHVFQLAMVTSTQATEDINAADYTSPYEGYVSDLIDQATKAWKKGFGWDDDFAINCPPFATDVYPYELSWAQVLYLNATGTHEDGIGPCCGCDFSGEVIVDPLPTAGSITLVDDGNCRAHLAISQNFAPLDATYTITVSVSDMCGDQTDELTFEVSVVEYCDCGIKGDVTCDGNTNPLDVSYIVLSVYCSCGYWGCEHPDCPWWDGDLNCDHSFDPLDVMTLVNYVYLGVDNLCDRCTVVP
ncbi:hypothetical protein ACFLQW_01085 [Candidatus Zixiibacteriota bacterium]